MFELCVYLFAVVFVLLFLAPSEPKEAVLRTACGSADTALVQQLWAEACADDGAWLAELQQRDMEDLLALAPSPTQIDWQSVSDKQVRSLCELHGIKCNKRGRVAAIHRTRLMEVA
jgi:hypothetical protein